MVERSLKKGDVIGSNPIVVSFYFFFGQFYKGENEMKKLDDNSQAKQDYENLDLFLNSLNAIKYMRFDGDSDNYIKDYIHRSENLICYMRDEARREQLLCEVEDVTLPDFNEAIVYKEHIVLKFNCAKAFKNSHDILQKANDNLNKDLAASEDTMNAFKKFLDELGIPQVHLADLNKEFSDGKKETPEEKTGSEG